jgi:hypothetical protein
MTYLRDFAQLRELFAFLERMNTNMFELELIMDNPEGNNMITQFGTAIQNKTTVSLRGIQNLLEIQSLIEQSTHFRQAYIEQIRFTNTIVSGHINMQSRSVSIIFHTIDSIENIVHQLIDIPIPTFELNIKIFHTGRNLRSAMS